MRAGGGCLSIPQLARHQTVVGQWAVYRGDAKGLLHSSNYGCWMLTRFPLTIDNILTCWLTRADHALYLTIDNIDRSGQNRRSTSIPFRRLLVRQNRNTKRVNTLVRCSMDMVFWQHFSGDFRKTLVVSEHFGLRRAEAPWSIKYHSNINSLIVLSIFCYHRHSGVVEAAQIPETIDNILTIDRSSNVLQQYIQYFYRALGDAL
jgi:hypothetical protein